MKHVTEVTALLQELQSLTGADLTESEATIVQAYQAKENNRGSLFIRILSIAGGFLAMVFLLACLALFGAFDTEASIISIGCVLALVGLVGAQQVKHLLIDTIAATAFMAGLVLIGVGAGSASMTLAQVCLLMVVVGLVSLAFTSNAVLAFISALTATGCLFFAFPDAAGSVAVLITRCLLAWGISLLVVHEARVITFHPRMAALYRPVFLALVCSLLGGYFVGWFGLFPYLYGPVNYIEPVATIAAVLYATVPVLKRLGVANRAQTWKIIAGTTLVLAPTIFVPGVPAALLVLLLSFGWFFPAGIVLGAAGLIYYIGQYYYDLQLTLLLKAGLLLAPGVLLIGLYVVLHQFFQRDEKV